jgi:D-alanine-D-alanine ligase
MRITILHQAISEESAVDEQDVLRQREAVGEALQRLGHEVAIFACTLALDELRRSLEHARPDVVFNLVESLGGSDRLMALVPLLLESLQIPYTGAAAQAILATGSKTLAKTRLARAGLPTSPWVDTEAHDRAIHNVDALPISWPSRWIRKPIYEHASLGMTDDAVVECASLEELIEQTRCWQRSLRRPCLAEPYIEGREFNFSLLAGSDGPRVLPPAEIEFINFVANKPRIVGFAAKWHEQASEYRQTPRKFDFPDRDHPLLDQLADLATRCWTLFAMSGYCRVDFRIDERGRPWILEVNANPCLSPDAGFAAAVAAAGLTYNEGIASVVRDCTGPHSPILR